MNELDKILDSLPGDSMVFFEAREDFKQAIEAYIAERESQAVKKHYKELHRDRTPAELIEGFKELGFPELANLVETVDNFGRLDHLSKKGEDNGHK